MVSSKGHTVFTDFSLMIDIYDLSGQDCLCLKNAFVIAFGLFYLILFTLIPCADSRIETVVYMIGGSSISMDVLPSATYTQVIRQCRGLLGVNLV